MGSATENASAEKEDVHRVLKLVKSLRFWIGPSEDKVLMTGITSWDELGGGKFAKKHCYYLDRRELATKYIRFKLERRLFLSPREGVSVLPVREE